MDTTIDKSGLISQTSTKKKIREYNIDTLDTDEYILDRDYECYCDDAELSNISDETLYVAGTILPGPGVYMCAATIYSMEDNKGSLTPNNFSIKGITLNSMNATYFNQKDFLLTIVPSNYSLKYDNIVYKSGTIAKDLFIKMQPDFYKSNMFRDIKSGPFQIQIVKEST